ncbi:hypothetical protein [Nonomuraea roseola]|uniref:ABC transporter n=1 Tax=Nonomuraea roseola TaxID=46179 RepID=A0ABV5Q458_9ACTN
MVAGVLAGVLLAGCAPREGGTDEAVASGGTEQEAAVSGGAEREAVPHGYVEGAEETAEPQYRLVLADGAQAHVFDLLTERATAVADVAGVREATGDGRFAYLTTGAGGLRVVDSGGWTVDHGDHMHYYRAATRDLGVIAGTAPYEVAADPAVTAVRSADGTVTLYDRARMEKGELAEMGRIAGAAAAVPYRDRLLVAEDGGGVRVRTRTGEAGAAVGNCPDAAGTAVTRRGVVFGCADGALLVAEKEGEFEGVKIRYPRKTAAGERVTAFRHRPGSSTLAAKAGDAGVWVLDVADRVWRRLRTGPVVAVSATGEDTPVVSLGADGVLRAHDSVTGKQTAETRLFETPPTGSPTIQTDTARAYVNDPAGQVIHEIDYNDALRRARTFRPGFVPAHMTETGR